MIFNEIKCHVNTSLGLVGGCIRPCVRAYPVTCKRFTPQKRRFKWESAANPNAVDLAMDLLLHRPANTGENQLISNLKPQIFANNIVASKKVKICT